ncbi:MAG: putative N-acetyltransferase [Candidatus Heimdallarchaeota archaeon LC_3]|nr:MAG: putative N-acetyltransferase [Candidatus Heimdallarchaeota archaeon LC_3]
MTVTQAYKIRSFKPADLSRVVRINQVCLPENYPESFFLLIYSSFPEGFLVAESSDIDGYTMNRIEMGSPSLQSTRWPLKRIKKGHVISIAVMPYARRQKVGVKLMLASLKEMSEQGAEECFLEVRESNESAIEMYYNLGFSKKKLLKKYYSDSESAYLMAIPLPIPDFFIEDEDLF